MLTRLHEAVSPTHSSSPVLFLTSNSIFTKLHIFNFLLLFCERKKKKQIHLALQKTNPVCETIPLGQPPEVNCLIFWEDEHCYKERVGTGRWKEIQRVWTVVAPCTEDIGSTTDGTVLTAVLQLAEAHNGFLPLTQGWPGSYNYS